MGGLMRVNRNFSRTLSAAAIAALALAQLTVAQAAQRHGSQKTRISNFGCINETFYRGAQPKGRDYDDLAAMGVKTVIDLQEDGERNEARPALVYARRRREPADRTRSLRAA